MNTIICRFCGSKTNVNELCTICKCITTASIPEDISANSKFTDYSYNNYSSNFLNYIFQNWNRTNSFLIFKKDIISKFIKLVLSPITTTNPVIDLPSKGSLIDIGCGRGDFLKYLPEEIDYLGVDIVDYGLNDPKITILNFETDQVNGTFNFARSIHSIEHAQNPGSFLKKISGLVEKDGLLILATPNSKFWLKKYLGENWITLKVKTHYCILSPEALEKELKDLGFQILDSSTYTLFSYIGSFTEKFKLKQNILSFFIFVFLSYPLAVLERLFGVADSIIIYAKKI